MEFASPFDVNEAEVSPAEVNMEVEKLGQIMHEDSQLVLRNTVDFPNSLYPLTVSRARRVIRGITVGWVGDIVDTVSKTITITITRVPLGWTRNCQIVTVQTVLVV